MSSTPRAACDSCRIRKKRCSGDRTGCTRCSRSSISCIYSRTRPLGRPSRHLSDMRTPGSTTESDHGRPGSFRFVTPESLATEPETRSTASIGEERHNSNFDSLQPIRVATPSALMTNEPEFERSTTSVTAVANTAQTDSTTVSSSKRVRCSCLIRTFEAVQELSQTDDDDDVLPRIYKVRCAMEVAKQLMNCQTCYDFNDKYTQTCYNVLQLSHLLSAIAFCCTATWRATFNNMNMSRRINSPQQPSGNVTNNNQTLAISDLRQILRPDEIKQLEQNCIRNDTKALSQLCQEFEARQIQRHVHNHELCGYIDICISGTLPSVTSVEACYARNDIRHVYPCFRSVEQAKAALQSCLDVVASGMEGPRS